MTLLAPNVGSGATTPSPLDLLGVWTLRRRLVDRRLGLSGTVTGTLRFTLDGDDVRWSERGRMTLAGGVHEVGREMRVVPAPPSQPSGPGWQVCFADGRPFHEWAFETALLHPCRADTYRGRIVHDRGGSRLRILWDVSGPAKEQRIVTRCVRV